MSKNKTDRRLLDMVRIQQASRRGIKLGFKSLNFKEYESGLEEELSLKRS